MKQIKVGGGRLGRSFLAGLIAALWPRNLQDRMEDFRPTPARALGCGVLAVWSILSFSGVSTFIYSNF